MLKKINLPTELLTPRVAKIRDELLSRFKLSASHLMSTSGKNYVALCLDQNKNRYLLKIIRQLGPQNKAEFSREANIYEYFEKIKHPQILFTKNVITNPGPAKEYLLYNFIKGTECGTYFFLNTPARENLSARMIIKALIFLHQQTQPIQKQVQLQKLDSKFYKKLLTIYQKTGQKYLGSDFFQGRKLVLENLAALQKNKVFTHGDFNLKNLILPYPKNSQQVIKNKLALIDWSDATLANPGYDAAFFMIACGNKPQLQADFAKQVQSKLKVSKKIFYTNLLVLIPRFIEMTVQFELAITAEYKQKIFNKKIYSKLITTAHNSRAGQIKLYRQILKDF